ncbi:DMT family transporter [Desulfurococcaceae archaeon MEX13E-LK6-19]|nr:DMT family transporter [Desulfurococcaceae archaeon MEX13E-LK6-19]
MEYINQFYGVVLALLASVLWSLNPPIIKKFGYGISSIALNAMRAFMAMLFLVIIVIVYGFNVVFTPMGLLFILGSALIGPGIGDIMYIKSIRAVGAGRAITIGYTYVFVAQALAVVFLGEKITVGLVIGSFLALCGIYFVYLEGNDLEVSYRNLLMALIPAIAWGIGSVVNKYALFYADPISLGFIRAIVLSLVLLPFSSREIKKGVKSRRIVLVALVTGGLGYGIGIPLFLKAVDIVGVSVTVLATTLTPVLGRILSVVIAKEKIDLKGIIGTSLVILGIVIGVQ